MRFSCLTLACALLLAGCADFPRQQFRSDGTPLPEAYRISRADAPRIQFRMLDSVNALRRGSGLRPVKLNASLIAAAATHSRDMSAQNRPWHFGSDGSSPAVRAWNAGYRQTMLGENISETFETEIETLVVWMNEAAARSVILNPRAEHLGFQWHQDRSGKIWWTLIMGGGPRPSPPAPPARLPPETQDEEPAVEDVPQG